MSRINKSRFVLLRIGIYLVAVILISTPYWLSDRRPQLCYSAVDADGTLKRNGGTKSLSNASPPPDFVIEDDKLYLLTETIVVSPFNPLKRNKIRKTWNNNELHELLSRHPELKKYLPQLSARSEIIRLNLQ